MYCGLSRYRESNRVESHVSLLYNICQEVFSSFFYFSPNFYFIIFTHTVLPSFFCSRARLCSPTMLIETNSLFFFFFYISILAGSSLERLLLLLLPDRYYRHPPAASAVVVVVHSWWSEQTLLFCLCAERERQGRMCFLTSIEKKILADFSPDNFVMGGALWLSYCTVSLMQLTVQHHFIAARGRKWYSKLIGKIRKSILRWIDSGALSVMWRNSTCV